MYEIAGKQILQEIYNKTAINSLFNIKDQHMGSTTTKKPQ